MSWYEQWFDTDEYELVYQKRDDQEASAAVDLVERTTGMRRPTRVLDVGCGRGRHSIEFANRGHTVTGLDLSERSLDAARRKAAEADVAVDFVRGDMREPLGQVFDVVVNLFTAFGYFDDTEDHQRAVNAMASSVDKDGWLVQDFLNADHVRATMVASDQRTVGDFQIRQRRRIKEGRIRKVIEFSRGNESHAFEESVALLDLDDFRRMYARAGLRLVHVFGDYEGGPHTPVSPRTILFSQWV